MILFIDTAFDKTLLAIKNGNEIYYKEIIENNFISKNIINSVDELIKKTNSKKIILNTYVLIMALETLQVLGLDYHIQRLYPFI